MAESKVQIQYGALADSLEQQLNTQGFTLGEKQEFIEKLQYSLTYCMFHLLTDAQYQSCLKKFHKKVMSSIKSL
ncbi:hypothetical protein [Psychrobacillus phage Perkons]|nr:hypothetical protein [Psychrobacillus phage Perkons]